VPLFDTSVELTGWQLLRDRPAPRSGCGICARKSLITAA
jgi:hypothetical protein